MTKYILKRFVILLLTLWFVITITFFLMQILPGTPYSNPRLTDEMVELLNKQYGLDKPIWQQYLIYLHNILHGKLGTSYQAMDRPVMELIVKKLGVSIQLGVQALSIGVFAGLLMGGVAAQNKNKWIDSVVSLVSTVGISVPSFIIALVLLNVFGYKLDRLPLTGWGSFAETVMPSLALALPICAQVTRFFRTELIESLNSDYIQLARAKGLTKNQAVRRHAYRNSMIPVLTLVGPMAAKLLTGSVLIEQIFSIPGIGQEFVSSVPAKDYPVIMGTTLVYAVMLMVIILITDILTSIVDPRVRL